MAGEGTGQVNGKRNYSRQQARAMFKRIQRTKGENAALEAEREQRRRDDPVEIAQATLRRCGYNCVHRESLTKPGSKLFVVGRRVMNKADLLKLAAHLDPRKRKP